MSCRMHLNLLRSFGNSSTSYVDDGSFHQGSIYLCGPTEKCTYLRHLQVSRLVFEAHTIPALMSASRADVAFSDAVLWCVLNLPPWHSSPN